MEVLNIPIKHLLEDVKAGCWGLELVSGDEAYKSIYQYFEIILRDMINVVFGGYIKLFFLALKSWNDLIKQLNLPGGDTTRKNILCITANSLYNTPNRILYKNILPTIIDIKMFQTKGPTVKSYNDLKTGEELKQKVHVSKCTMKIFDYENVRKNVKNFIDYVVNRSTMANVYIQLSNKTAESHSQFLTDLYSRVESIKNLPTFMETFVTQIMRILTIRQTDLGKKHNIFVHIDMSTIFFVTDFKYDDTNVRFQGNIDALIADLGDCDGIDDQRDHAPEQGAAPDQRPSRFAKLKFVINTRFVDEELERIRRELTPEQREQNEKSLLEYDAKTTKMPQEEREREREKELSLASKLEINYEIFQMLFNCSLSQLNADAEIMSTYSHEDIYHYLSSSNLGRYMQFTEVNAKYLFIVGYLQNKLRYPFLIVGRTALQLNCVLLHDKIAKKVQFVEFFGAFQKECTDFDCVFVNPNGLIHKDTFFMVYHLFLKKFLNGREIVMKHKNSSMLEQSKINEIKMRHQILEILSVNSNETIKIKEGDGQMVRSVCDITFKPRSVPPLIQLFLTNPRELILKPHDDVKSELTELLVSFKFPSQNLLLFECVGIVNSILIEFKTRKTEENEKYQFFNLLKFASRACQCAYLISIETNLDFKRENVGLHLSVFFILQAQSAKFENDLIIQILSLFLQQKSEHEYMLNLEAYLQLKSYKETGTITNIVSDIFKLLQKGVLKLRGNLAFSLVAAAAHWQAAQDGQVSEAREYLNDGEKEGEILASAAAEATAAALGRFKGGKINKKIKSINKINKINKKIKNTKKYKRINKKCHITTRRKNKKRRITRKVVQIGGLPPTKREYYEEKLNQYCVYFCLYNAIKDDSVLISSGYKNDLLELLKEFKHDSFSSLFPDSLFKDKSKEHASNLEVKEQLLQQLTQTTTPISPIIRKCFITFISNFGKLQFDEKLNLLKYLVKKTVQKSSDLLSNTNFIDISESDEQFKSKTGVSERALLYLKELDSCISAMSQQAQRPTQTQDEVAAAFAAAFPLSPSNSR